MSHDSAVERGPGVSAEALVSATPINTRALHSCLSKLLPAPQVNLRGSGHRASFSPAPLRVAMKSQEQASLAPRHLCVSWTGKKSEISDFSNLDSVSGAQWAVEQRPLFVFLFASDHRVARAPCGSD